MRVTFAGYFRPALDYGVSRAVIEFMRCFRRLGHASSIVSVLDGGNPAHRRLVEVLSSSPLATGAVTWDQGCSAVLDDVPVRLELAREGSAVQKGVARLADLITQEGADLVVTAEGDSQAPLAARIALRPKVHCFHSVIGVLRAEHSGFLPRLLQSSPVLASSAFLRGRVQEILGLRSRVLYPVFELERFACGELAAQHAPVGYYSGGPHKGDDLVLDLAEHMPSVPFLVLGRRFAQARQVLPPNITRLGDTVHVGCDFYGKISAVVVPSLCEEAFSRVILEAAVSGVPAIAVAAGGIPEALGDCGVLISTGATRSPSDMAAGFKGAIEALRHDRALFEEMCRRAKARAARYMDEQTVAERETIEWLAGIAAPVPRREHGEGGAAVGRIRRAAAVG